MNKTQKVVMWIGIAVCIIVVWLAPTTVDNYRRGKVTDYGSLVMILGGITLVTCAAIYRRRDK